MWCSCAGQITFKKQQHFVHQPFSYVSPASCFSLNGRLGSHFCAGWDGWSRPCTGNGISDYAALQLAAAYKQSPSCQKITMIGTISLSLTPLNRGRIFSCVHRRPFPSSMVSGLRCLSVCFLSYPPPSRQPTSCRQRSVPCSAR